MATDLVYITIGVPYNGIPIMDKVTTYVDTRHETAIKVAKMMRKRVADNIENHGFTRGSKFNPSQLSYMIYAKADDIVPYCASSNAFSRNSHYEDHD